MRGMQQDVCGCFPTGKHYPGIADVIAAQVQTVAGLSKAFDASAAWQSIPLAVIDFETTGFDENHDRVVEVGVVCFENGEKTVTLKGEHIAEEFQHLVNEYVVKTYSTG